MDKNIELEETITNQVNSNGNSPDFSITNSPMRKRLKLIDLSGDLDNISPSYYNNVETNDKNSYDLLEKSTALNMFMLLIKNIKAAAFVHWLFILLFSCVLTSKNSYYLLSNTIYV